MEAISIIYKFKTRQQIADEYGISPRTLRRWLKTYNINLPRRLVSPKDQLVIYSVFGKPVAEPSW
ncbi:MAG: helix-turn-helix domain-containing protein [Bacteroidota bacterium]